VVGAILERAVKTHGLVRNPARQVAKLRERYDPHAYDFYSPEEIKALGTAAASEQDRAIYLAAAFTGLRMGELIALRWGDVDFDTEAPARLRLVLPRHLDRTQGRADADGASR